MTHLTLGLAFDPVRGLWFYGIGIRQFVLRPDEFLSLPLPLQRTLKRIETGLYEQGHRQPSSFDTRKFVQAVEDFKAKGGTIQKVGVTPGPTLEELFGDLT